VRSHVCIFSGVGCFGIAAERFGYTTTHCVEIDPFCREILQLRYPNASIQRDIRCPKLKLPDRPDLLTMGFPCQGLSSAGLGAGLEDDRSALWFDGLRIIRETRPELVLIENVAVLRSRGLDVVVRGLADAGYGCWWDCVPALAVGAPHLRDRIWITAVPFERMPEYGGGSKNDTLTAWRLGPKLPRAAHCTRGFPHHCIEDAPKATIRDCKAAMGAVKREDGITWLTSLDAPLFLTPCRSDYKGAGPLDRRPRCDDDLPTRVAREVRLWPTATAHPRTHTPRPVHHGRQLANEVAMEEVRLWPTPHGMSRPGLRASGPSGNELGYAVGRAVPAPIQVVRGNKVNSSHGEQRLWPTPCRGDGTGGPGRSPKRTGGDNLRTAAAPGSLNPDWVEALMLVPVGWTDPDRGEPVHVDWREGEPPIPRVLPDVAHRKQRLMAIGNGLVWPVAATRLAQAHELLGLA
jgi:site-specific DNA-cytosine methylase